jgi:hypothetical protein
MIDWYFVFTHSLWILGLTIALAAFSYHDWLRKDLGTRLRQQLREPSFRFPLNIGLMLVAVAFVLLESSRWWERVLWLLIACSFGWGARTAGRAMNAPKDKQQYMS